MNSKQTIQPLANELWPRHGKHSREVGVLLSFCEKSGIPQKGHRGVHNAVADIIK